MPRPSGSQGKWEAIARQVGFHENGRHDMHLAKTKAQNPIAPPGVEAKEASVFLPPWATQSLTPSTLTKLLCNHVPLLLLNPKNKQSTATDPTRYRRTSRGS
ncbi:hypothetical protein V8C26DRAFT_390398 [Trichoderma gracile]